MESKAPPRLRRRWAFLAGLWADLSGGAVLAYLFAGRNGVVDPADRALLMAYGALTCALLLSPLSLLLSVLAGGIAGRRPDRPPDQILTTSISLHAAMFILFYGLCSRASQWWFYERGTGILSTINLLATAGWLGGATAVYLVFQTAWKLRRRWNVRIRSLCGAVSILLGLAPFAHIPQPAPRAAPPPSRIPLLPQPSTGLRVLWIGIDGGDWRLLRPMMDRGDMPVLAGLLRRGAWGPLESVPPYASQPCWVTAATGALPETHGVSSRLMIRFPGVRPFNVRYQTKEFLPVYGAGFLLLELGLVEAIPVPRYCWHAEPIWVSLSRSHRRCAVIGWPSTWPADVIDGLVVTDRFPHSVWEAFYGHARGLPGSVHPPDRLAWARALRVNPRSFTEAQARLFFDPSPDLLERFRSRAIHALDRDPLAYLGRGIGMDLTDMAIAAEVLREGAPDLLAVYTTGFDLAAHGFWIEQEPERFPGASPSGRPELREVLTRYCRFLDAEIGRLASRAPPDTVILLSSDHGVTPSPLHPVWPTAHDREGMLLLAGPPIREGIRIEGARLQDLAATVAHLLGAPPPPQSQGKVLTDYLTQDFLRSHPLPPQRP